MSEVPYRRTFVRLLRFLGPYKGSLALSTLLAVLSHTTSFSVGCYCEDEAHCHRSILKRLLVEHGAKVE